MREPDFVDECYADKDLSLLKKLTLVIPTYNRNFYLSRCLWYHAHFPFGEIIVADSSPEEKKVVNRETVAKIREKFGANIRYLEYEPETEKYGGDIYRKWGDAVQHVGTEYAQIVTDKEFIIPSSINKCIALIMDTEYIAISGKVMNILQYDYFKKENDYRFTDRYPDKCSEDAEDNLSRFIHALIGPPIWNSSLLLDLFPTPILKEIYSWRNRYDINDIRYGEILLAYGCHFMGKNKYVSELNFKIRDEIEIQRYRKNIRKEDPLKGSSESSSTRYPLINEYQYSEVGRVLTDNYNTCVEDLIRCYTNYSEKQIADFMENLFNQNFWYRCSGVTISRYSKIWHSSKTIFITYQMLPQGVSSLLNKIVVKFWNFSLPSIPIPIKNDNDINIIIKLISSTKKNTNGDTAI